MRSAAAPAARGTRAPRAAARAASGVHRVLRYALAADRHVSPALHRATHCCSAQKTSLFGAASGQGVQSASEQPRFGLGSTQASPQRFWLGPQRPPPVPPVRPSRPPAPPDPSTFRPRRRRGPCRRCPRADFAAGPISPTDAPRAALAAHPIEPALGSDPGADRAGAGERVVSGHVVLVDSNQDVAAGAQHADQQPRACVDRSAHCRTLPAVEVRLSVPVLCLSSQLTPDPFKVRPGSGWTRRDYSAGAGSLRARRYSITPGRIDRKMIPKST